MQTASDCCKIEIIFELQSYAKQRSRDVIEYLSSVLAIRHLYRGQESAYLVRR